MTDSFVQRYAAGEYLQVWDDLQALGPTVYQAPYYDQARTVARETMRRVRANIEWLIPRLQQMGYTFGYDWAQPILQREFSLGGRTFAHDLMADQPPLFALPSPETPCQLQQLAPLLPLSVYTWYETIGAVNFTGTPPATWVNPWKLLLAQYPDPDRYPDEIPEFDWEAAASRVTKDAKPSLHELDPLSICDLSHLLQQQAPFFELAPDEWFKELCSGGGSYGVSVPSRSADTLFDGEWHHTTFVNYLRICMHWGGLPGLETWTIPQGDLAVLRQGLLAF